MVLKEEFKRSLVFWSIPIVALLCWFLKDVLFIILISIFLGLAVQQWAIYIKLKFKIPFYLNIALIYLTFALLFVVIFYILAPAIVLELKNILPNIQDYIENLGLKGISNYLTNFLKTPAPEFFINTSKYLINMIGGLFNLILILVMSFYVATQVNLTPEFLARIFKENSKRYFNLIEKIKKGLAAWLASQLFLMISVGLASFLLMFFLKLPYAGIIGLIAGFTEIIPIIGPILGATAAIILTLAHDPSKIIFVLIGFVLIQQLENNLLVPLVARAALKIKPFITLVGILIGGKIGGILGIFSVLPLLVIFYEIYEEFFKIK
jgi:predicted PurR-regulated permease PerM